MKKYYFAITIMAIMMASCAKETELTKEDTSQELHQTLYTLQAKVDSELTKVQADNAGAFSWQAGDVISVLNSSNEPQDYTTTNGGAEVNFSGSIAPENLGSYAFYPANDAHSNIVFALGPELDWNAKASNMPMIGPIENETASFKAVGAVIKLICFNVPDNARVLAVSSNSQQLSGTFTFSGSPLAITAGETVSADDKTISINFTADNITACSNNMVFYIPVPSGSLGKLTFALKTAADGDVLFSQTTKTGISVTRNQIILPPVLNCSVGVLMWSESFKGYSGSEDFTTEAGILTDTPTYEAYAYEGAAIKYLSGESGTKVYPDDAYAGGTKPELLIKSSNGTFTIKNIPTNSAKQLILTFLSNKTTFTITPSGNATVSSLSTSDGVVTARISNPTPLTSIDLEIKNTGSTNARVDNFEVRAIDSYTLPAITPEANDLSIAVSAGDQNSVSTSFTYTNALDDMPVVAIASDDWITPTISGSGPYTLTVTAAKKTTTGSRAGTVLLRAAGVSKSIAVSQPSAFVPKPSVSVVPGDGSFTATWTKETNAVSYAVYLDDPSNEANNISDEANLVDNTYTLTKAVANGAHDLYVKVNTVTANYVAEDGFTQKSFTCSSEVQALSTVSGLSIEDIYLEEGNETISIKFSAVENASGYEWVISKEYFANPATIDDIDSFDEEQIVSFGDEGDLTEDEGVYSGTIDSFADGMTPVAGTVYYLYVRAVGDGVSFATSDYGQGHAILYQHVFTTKPSTGNSVTLSDISWTITATNLGSYNSNNYAGVQFGTSKNNGEITLTSNNNWGAQNSTNYYGYGTVKKVNVWANLGGTSVTPSVSIGGTSAIGTGSVSKNSSAGPDWTKTSKVVFTPGTNAQSQVVNSGVVVIGLTSVKAGYICAIEILSE